MRSIGKVVIVLGLVLCGSSPSSAMTAVTPGGTPSPYKTPREAEAAAVKALGGDADAAWGLFLYFTGEPFDRERANYWMQIAVENRNPNALYYYGERLGESDDPCRNLRAIYFLELDRKSVV